MSHSRAEMEVLEYRDYIARSVSEKSFQSWVRQFALLMGWLYFHDQDSRKNDEGFPDTVLTRDGLLIFAELKVKKNTRSDQQVAWGDALELVATHARNVGLGGRHPEPIRYFLWYPKDADEIVAVLKRPWLEVVLN